MYSVSPEERHLVADFAEAETAKRWLTRSAVGAGILGIFTLPVGLLIWAFALVLAIQAGRTSNRMERIRSRVSSLRTFPNPSPIQTGTAVSLIPSPYGLVGERLVGRVGSYSDGYGEAKILSEPLGGQYHVSKHSGSFSIRCGDWVKIHQEESGELTIWDRGGLTDDLLERARETGDEKLKKMGELGQLNRKQVEAIQALEDLIDADEQFRGELENQSSDPPGPSDDQIWSKQRIVNTFGIPEELFEIKYRSYEMVLRMSGATSHWNQDVDRIAREKAALTEDEIALAEHDFHQAVSNRVKLALVMEGFPKGSNGDD